MDFKHHEKQWLAALLSYEIWLITKVKLQPKIKIHKKERQLSTQELRALQYSAT